MPRIKKENIPLLTTSLMHSENERQYHAWLLYNETGTLENLMKIWERLHQGYTRDTPEIDGLRDKLNKPPSFDTLKNWSRKYRWVDRTALLLAEEIERLRGRTEKFREKRKFLVTDLLITKINKLQKQARTETSTVVEVRSLWEMHRTEFDEITGKSDVSHHINETEQYPPTEDEKELGRKIDELIKQHYDKKR